MQYSVVANSLSADAREAAQLSRQLGFAGLLFDAFSSGFDIPSLSGTGRREFLHVLSSQEQKLTGLRVDLGTKGLGPGADVDRLLSQFNKVLESAAGLMAPLVCVELGPVPEPAREAKPRRAVTADEAGLILIPSFADVPKEEPEPVSRPMDAKFANQVDVAMAELGKLADRYSVMLAFRCELSSFAALQRTVLAAHCPWFGIDLDPVSILRDEWPADEIFSRLGTWIRNVRGRDAAVGADKRTKPMPISRGDTKWDQLLDNLREADFNGWITVDPGELNDRQKAAVAGLKYLKMHE